jgi:drug/metabolite transporter (DMT)-like permease
MAPLLFIIVSLIWGSSFILMREASPAFGPITIGMLRLLLGAGALLIFFLAQRKPWVLRREHIPGLLFVGVVSYAWPFALQPYLIRLHGSALMGMSLCLTPLMTMLVSIPLLKIHPTRRQLLGVVLGLGFFAILLNNARSVGGVPLRDLLLAATVPLSYAVAHTYVKRRFADLPAMPLTLGALGLAGLVLLPLSMGYETVNTGPGFGAAALAMALLALLSTGLAYYLFYLLIQTHGPLYAGMVTYLIPVVAIFWGWLYKEQITLTQIAAMAGVLVSVVMVQYRAGAKAIDVPE